MIEQWIKLWKKKEKNYWPWKVPVYSWCEEVCNLGGLCGVTHKEVLFWRETTLVWLPSMDLALLPTPEERGVNVGATEIPIIS